MSNLKSPLDGHLTDWEWEGPGLSIAAVTATNPKHTQTLRPPAPYNTVPKILECILHSVGFARRGTVVLRVTDGGGEERAGVFY